MEGQVVWVDGLIQIQLDGFLFPVRRVSGSSKGKLNIQ
jgi:hypothetical protein